ncbi:sulfotransferase domain-containing protein [Actinoplanes sp. NPDC049265]|uniref:sulfotransferase domain-containing protein n=1 Tax=Actinoplanes sp. NPDC049265 TaxID=3363902 RepID=UPI00371E259F
MRYRSSDEDSGRWYGFPFRAGDIVISTRSKSGTTWMQMICALLIFQTADLPAPLATLSPWLDWLIVPRDEVLARLAAQRHRRFIKTHTPLDGVPIDPRVTYIVVARDPLDLAVSLFHQGDNLNRARIAELTGAPPPVDEPAPPPDDEPMPPPVHEPMPSPDDEQAPPPVDEPAPPPDMRAALLRWIEQDVAPADDLDSLPGVMWHLTDAWRRPGVLLVHYADLLADLDAEMRRIAERLGIPVPDEVWSDLVEAAKFERMRGRAAELAPDPAGIMKDRTAFFRRGGSGSGRELLSDDEFARYQARAAELAPPDLLAWLHR